MLVMAFLVLLFVFYLTFRRVGGDPKFSVILALVIAVIWAVLCLVLVFNSTTDRLPEELSILAYSGVLFLLLLGLDLWQFRLRLALALPVAALSTSLWLLVVWLATARKYLK